VTTDEQPPDYISSRPTTQANRKNPSRRAWLKTILGLGTVGAAAGVYMRYWEPRWLKVSRHTLPPDKFLVQQSLRFLHLSDLHASEVVPFELIEEAIELGLAEKPDAAFLTGDFITSELSEDNFTRYGKILRKLTAKVPTFACLGNHDGGKWAESTYGYPTSEKVEDLLAKSGVFLLKNHSRKLFIKGQKMTIAGVGDLWNDEMRPKGMLRSRGNGQSPADRPPILLLCHNPDSKDPDPKGKRDHLDPYEWDLMLCGHTHGGQCVLPWLGTPFAPVRDPHYVEGLHEWKDRLIHITRGVGNLHGLRLNCRPEVSLLEVNPPPPPED